MWFYREFHAQTISLPDAMTSSSLIVVTASLSDTQGKPDEENI